MKQSSKCAIGGIVAALSLVLLISIAVVPFLTYALPAFAGAILIFAVIEIGKAWSFGIYAAVAILGIFLVPEKEVAMMYLCFFGYYPILKSILETKFNRVIEWILKILAFLAAISGSYFLMIKFMGITVDELDKYGYVAIPVLLGLGTLAFILYDIMLGKVAQIYNLKWRKYFKKYFK